MAITENLRQKVRFASLAEKHNCDPSYVSKILNGEREANSEKAKAILKDAKRILKIIEE